MFQLAFESRMFGIAELVFQAERDVYIDIVEQL